MNALVIHFGVNPTSLATILRAFNNLKGEYEIHLIDDDNLNDESTTFFWSNLKLQKRYSITREFDFKQKFDEVEIKSVIDIERFQTLKEKIILDRHVHFILSQTTLEIQNNFHLIYELLTVRSKGKRNLTTLFYLVNNYRTSEFLRRFRLFCNRSGLEYDLKWNNSFFIECISDVLSSISAKNSDKCVIFSESDRVVFINREDFLLPPFSHDIYKQNYLNFNFLLPDDLYLLVSNIEEVRSMYLVERIYKYLLSVFTIDAGHWYTSGYFKFNKTDANYICSSLKSELAQEFGDVSFLSNFDLRLDSGDNNAIYTLGIGNKQKLQEIYNVLLDEFTKSKRTNFVSDKSTLVGYALNLLYEELNSMK